MERKTKVKQKAKNDWNESRWEKEPEQRWELVFYPMGALHPGAPNLVPCRTHILPDTFMDTKAHNNNS